MHPVCQPRRRARCAPSVRGGDPVWCQPPDPDRRVQQHAQRSASKSVSRAVKRCFRGIFDVRVLSVDLDPTSNPTVVADITKWTYKPALQQFVHDRRACDLVLVWQSPPCTPFSFANTTGVRDLDGGNRNVKAGLKITKYLAPDAFFLESQVGLLMQQPWIQSFNERYLNLTSYCRYGKPYRKNTCIWTDVPGLDLKVCAGAARCAQSPEIKFTHDWVDRKFKLRFCKVQS